MGIGSSSIDEDEFKNIEQSALEKLQSQLTDLYSDEECEQKKKLIAEIGTSAQEQMSAVGGAIRDIEKIEKFVQGTLERLSNFADQKLLNRSFFELGFRLWNTLLTQYAFLKSFLEYYHHGGGSRGSGLILASITEGSQIIPHPSLVKYQFLPRNHELDNEILEIDIELSDFSLQSKINSHTKWVNCSPIPHVENWFENTWQEYEERDIFK